MIVNAVVPDRTEKKHKINTQVSNGKNNEEKANTAGMRKIGSNNGFELNITEKNNKVDVHINRPYQTINLTIKVPQKFSLKLHTVQGGDIVVENVDGNHEISNVNGSIVLNNIDGSVVANTVNEDVKVTFNSITANTLMAFSTISGNVDVTFPASLKANLKMKSDFGEVLSDFDIDIDKMPAKLKSRSEKDKGYYKISKDEWTYGKINGGGPEIMMKSLSGNVFLRKKK